MIFEYFRHPDRVLPVIDRAHDLEDQRPTAADRREAAGSTRPAGRAIPE
jgi:hypothetical protein